MEKDLKTKRDKSKNNEYAKTYRDKNKKATAYRKNKSASLNFIKKEADFVDLNELEELINLKRAELIKLDKEENVKLILAKELMLNKKVTLYEIETNTELRKLIADKIFKAMKEFVFGEKGKQKFESESGVDSFLKKYAKANKEVVE